MAPRLFGREISRRGTTGAAGAAGIVVAALAVSLLAPGWEDDQDTSPPPRKAGPSATPLDHDEARAKAARTGKRVEVTSLRDATSTTYVLPKGGFELSASAAPVRAKVRRKWRAIDTTLTRTRDGWAPKAANEPAVFSAGSKTAGEPGAKSPTARHAAFSVSQASLPHSSLTAETAVDYSELATFHSGGHEVTLSWPGPLPEPVVNGSSALYRSVLEGVDLMLTARDSGFGHVLIVHDAEAAANPALDSIRYKVSSPGLTFHLDQVTNVLTARDPSGAEIAVSPTPYMWDSAGKPAVTEGDDPEPADPGEEPAPSASAEDQGEGIGEEKLPPGGFDTEGPAPSDDAGSGSPSKDDSVPSAEPSEGSADPVSLDRGTTRHSTVRTAFGAASAALSSADVFKLPGLQGPQPGTHAAVGDADLADPGSTSSTLTITPDRKWLNSPDMVWPAFIDPPLNGTTTNWTTVYKKYPTSSFYDGANYNSGTTEARVGYESTTNGLSRSLFRLGWKSSIKGATITSASIRLRETYAWSCTDREVQLYRTGGISSKTTWNNQPSWSDHIGTKSFAHGYNSSCPDSYVTYDAEPEAQKAADGGWKSMTIGLKASTEDSSYSWKKFRSEGESAPRLTIQYNRKPATPSSLDMTPGPTCDSSAPYPTIGKRDLTLYAKSSDPDGNTFSLDFELWRTGYSDTKIVDGNRATAGGAASVTVPYAKFTNGHTYSWRVRAVDELGAASGYAPNNDTGVCRFVYDGVPPSPPEVSSAAFPAADTNGTEWSAEPFGTPGPFTFSPDGQSGIVRFEYRFNAVGDRLVKTVASGQSASVTLSPPGAGPHILYVRSVDSAGNPSPDTPYKFYVKPKKEADKPGDVSGDGTPDLFSINAAGNLAMYPAAPGGDLHVSLKAAHKDGTPLDAAGKPGYWRGADGKTALLTHGGDVLPGDGITDLFARMPDGKLYVYQGDGYGSVDIRKRIGIRLPAGSPNPSTFDQMITGDYDLDGRPDLFVTVTGGGMWAFEGYTGAAFASATQIAVSAWLDRDLVSVGDHDKNGAPDLLWRSEASDRLYLRYGIKDGAGGATLGSLATAAGSATEKDEIYSEGWSKTVMPVSHLRGSPDFTGDGIPDIWALAADGSLKAYKGGASVIGSATPVISADSEWRTEHLSFG